MTLIRRNNSKNWYYQFQIQGKKFFGSTGTPNKTKAAQVEREMRNRAHSERYLGDSPEITVKDALEQYVESRKGTAYYSGMWSGIRKAMGYKLHSKTKAKLPCYGFHPDTLLHELTTRDFEVLVAKRKAEGDKPATIKHEIGLLRATINEMTKLGFKVNREIVFPALKTSYRLRYLDSNEESALLLELDPERRRNGLKPLETRTPEMTRNVQDNYDITVFLLDTGCRYSEVANIPWSAIDVDACTISLYRSKVRNEDVLHMTSRLETVLRRRWEERRPGQRYVFEDRTGSERGYSTKAIKKAIERAGLNDAAVVKERGGRVTLHTFRHTFASKLVRAGVSLYEVSVLLGHSDPKMTQRYAHLSPNDASRKAVKVIDSLLLNPA
ncbi:tyrosine-type recombinase/integrase [Paraburkholderia sp. ZP32-5]|uniref:tyrosine-type recombinase/integrase n=1 Tax=Paraburkholderia sp. ZP32-5 TaxID=2883245 RepID=UPI001F317834|nr:site-specific integrase [Paraburkholderia sp. ZP32-5]